MLDTASIQDTLNKLDALLLEARSYPNNVAHWPIALAKARAELAAFQHHLVNYNDQIGVARSSKIGDLGLPRYRLVEE